MIWWKQLIYTAKFSSFWWSSDFFLLFHSSWPMMPCQNKVFISWWNKTVKYPTHIHFFIRTQFKTDQYNNKWNHWQWSCLGWFYRTKENCEGMRLSYFSGSHSLFPVKFKSHKSGLTPWLCWSLEAYHGKHISNGYFLQTLTSQLKYFPSQLQLVAFYWSFLPLSLELLQRLCKHLVDGQWSLTFPLRLWLV